MSNIKPIPAYNQATGESLRDEFRAFNEAVGSEVVTNIRNITNTRYRHPYRASGRQLKIAFEQINAHTGLTLIDTCKPQNIADGRQLQCAFKAINDWLDKAETSIFWAAAVCPDCLVSTVRTGTSFDTNTYQDCEIV